MAVMDVLGYPANSVLQNAAPPQLYPYAPPLSPSATSSVSSVFSADSLSSQSSISSTSSSVDLSWESGCSTESNNHCLQSGKAYGLNSGQVPVPPELRQNPRRTGNVGGKGSEGACTRPPPSLVRQCERKVNFVDSLVDSAAQIVETIWPLSVVAMRSDAAGCKAVLPLRVFIQETLRRSRTSYSTLQVALYYLILIKSRVPKVDFTMEQPTEPACSRAMQCGRRMFLAALILASKYLQDRNYSSRAWSKISGLSTVEINQNEWAFLEAVDWKLHISEPVFQRWTDVVLKYTPNPGDSSNGEGLRWGKLIPLLTPELDTVGLKHEQPLNSTAHDTFLVPHTDPSSCYVPAADRLPRALYDANDRTPTDLRHDIPSTLEPNPRMDYPNVPLPSIPKLGLLPTPQMTPQSSLASTPAVSAGGFDSCKPSIGAALSRANSMTVQRTAMDRRPHPMYNKKENSFDPYPQGRRSSLARSASSSSSPESMVSDVASLASSRSTRSSRSSSISSAASGSCAPVQPRLAGRSLRRCPSMQTNYLKECRKNLMIATPIDEGDPLDIYSSPEQLPGLASNIPDFTNFSLGPPGDLSVSAAHEAAEGLCALSGKVHPSYPLCTRTQSSTQQTSSSASTSPSRRCRKRGRTASDDTCLQHNVRQLMALDQRKNEDDSTHVVPDNQVADSFLLPQPRPQVGSCSSFQAMKLPLRTQSGLKRACCGTDAAKSLWGLRGGGVSGGDAVDVVD